MRYLKHVLMMIWFMSPAAWANDNCRSWIEQLSVTGPTPFGPFNGAAMVSIGGEAPVSVLAGATLLGSAHFDPANPGPLAQKRAGQLLFPPGANGSIDILTARTDVMGVPTGPGTFAISGRVKFTGGVGRFEQSYGGANLTAVANVDLATGFTQFNATVKGNICEGNGDDD